MCPTNHGRVVDLPSSRRAISTRGRTADGRTLKLTVTVSRDMGVSTVEQAVLTQGGQLPHPDAKLINILEFFLIRQF